LSIWTETGLKLSNGMLAGATLAVNTSGRQAGGNDVGSFAGILVVPGA
jgi:hypothetical protein